MYVCIIMYAKLQDYFGKTGFACKVSITNVWN